MKPTTQEVLERLGLSEDQRAALAPILSQNEQLMTQLAETQKAARIDKVTNRVTELQEKLKMPPGFCKRYEEIALQDDGDVSAVLNLSENGNAGTQRDYTATEIAESLIAALPVDQSGALALAERSNLLSSPIDDRPPVDANDQKKVEETQAGNRVQTTDEWLAQAEKDSPGITAQAGLSLSTDKKEG